MKDLSASYITTAQAAEFLGYSPQTLKVSRCTGILAGVDSPKYIKMGKRIRYQIPALEDWVNQFPIRERTE